MWQYTLQNEKIKVYFVYKEAQISLMYLSETCYVVWRGKYYSFNHSVNKEIKTSSNVMLGIPLPWQLTL